MAALTVGIINGNKFSNDLTTATTLAQDKMEKLRLQDYSNVITETKTNCASPYEHYEIEVTVSNDSPAINMKRVLVTTYWQDKDGDQHQVDVKTILSK